MKKIFLVVGMAGSGKTTFCQKLYSWLSDKKMEIDSNTGLNKHIYSINLDPAVVNAKMPLNVDIRDSIDYDELMLTNNLGPNGAIVTAINLFLLEIDKFLSGIEADYIIIDTPGQIETFIWSSGGLVLVETLKKLNFDIKLLYIIDAKETERHTVFISNMLFAISMVSRYELDTICIFNKIDLVKDVVIDWVRDYELFRKDLPQEGETTPLLSSLALYFEEFYKDLKTVLVSSYTGEGKEELLECLTSIK